MVEEKHYHDGKLINYSSGTGYPTIWVDGKNVLLHRYVWEQNYGKIPEGYEIHHKDHDKTNWDIENLELLIAEEHHRKHALENGLGKSNKGKPKNHVSGYCGCRRKVIAISGEQTITFDSVSEASRVLNIPTTKISGVASGKRNIAYGWRFKYA